jgi:hypothetical protein
VAFFKGGGLISPLWLFSKEEANFFLIQREKYFQKPDFQKSDNNFKEGKYPPFEKGGLGGIYKRSFTTE